MFPDSMYSAPQCGQVTSTGVDWVLKTLTFTFQKHCLISFVLHFVRVKQLSYKFYWFARYIALHYLACIAKRWVTSWDIKACIPSKLAAVPTCLAPCSSSRLDCAPSTTLNLHYFSTTLPATMPRCIRAPPKRGRYWEIHPRRLWDFLRPKDPRTLEGGGDVFPNTFLVLVEYGHSPHHQSYPKDGSGNPSPYTGKDWQC